MSRRKQPRPRHRERDSEGPASLEDGGELTVEEIAAEDNGGGSEEDAHTCGKCRAQFFDLKEYQNHRATCRQSRLSLFYDDDTHDSTVVGDMEAENESQGDQSLFPEGSDFTMGSDDDINAEDGELKEDEEDLLDEDEEENNNFDELEKEEDKENSVSMVNRAKIGADYPSQISHLLTSQFPPPLLPSSNVTLEPLSNTKAAVAQFAENNMAAGPWTMDHVQMALRKMQQHHLEGLMMVQQFQQFLHQPLLLPPDLPRPAHLTEPPLPVPGPDVGRSAGKEQGGTEDKAEEASGPETSAAAEGVKPSAPVVAHPPPICPPGLEPPPKKPRSEARPGGPSSAGSAGPPKPQQPTTPSGQIYRGTILDRSQYASDDPFFKHKCRFCLKVFGSDSALQIHVRSHTGRQEFGGPKGRTNSALSFLAHLSSPSWSKQSERPYKCNICGNRFSTRGNLKVHFERHKEKYPDAKMNPDPQPEHLERGGMPSLPHLPASLASTFLGAPFAPPPPLPPHSMAHPMALPNMMPVMAPLPPTTMPSSVLRPPLQPPPLASKERRTSASPPEGGKKSESSPPPTSSASEKPHTPGSETPLPPLPPISSSMSPVVSSSLAPTYMPHLPSPALSYPGRTMPSSPIVSSHSLPGTPGFPLPSPLGSQLPLMSMGAPFVPPPPPTTMESSMFRSSLLPTKTIDPTENVEMYMECSKSETSKLEALVKNIDQKLTDPNQCVICHRVLSCKSALQMHYRIHTGERPFKCKICGRAFTTKGNLKTHMGVHRAKPPMRMMHQCPVCHKQFTNIVVLQQHIRVHQTDTMPGIPPPHDFRPSAMWMPPKPYDHRPFDLSSHHEAKELDLSQKNTSMYGLPSAESSHGFHRSSSSHEMSRSVSMNEDSNSNSKEDDEEFEEELLEEENIELRRAMAAEEEQERQLLEQERKEMAAVAAAAVAAGSTGLREGSKESRREDEDRRSESAHIEGKEGGRPSSAAASERSASRGGPSPQMSSSPQTSRPHSTGIPSMASSMYVNPYFPASTYPASLAALEEKVKSMETASAQSSFERFRNSMGLNTPRSLGDKALSPSGYPLPNGDPRSPASPRSSGGASEGGSEASFREDGGKLSGHFGDPALSPFGGGYSMLGALDLRPRGMEGRPNTTCDICLKTFACRSALEIHYRSHTKERPFKCTVCERAFSTRGNMRQHMLTHKIRDMPPHNFSNSNNNTNSNSSEQSEGEGKGTPASNESPSSQPQASGENAKPNGESEKSGSTPASASTGEEKKTPSQQSHSGSNASGGSSSHSHGHSHGHSHSHSHGHSHSHSSDKSKADHFSTPSSGSGSGGGSGGSGGSGGGGSSSHGYGGDFARRSNSKHMCPICQKNFSSASALQIHNRTHTGDKPFKCTVCGKAFTTKGNLKVHMGTHMWNNSPSRRGRRMSIDPPFLLGHPNMMKDNPFMQYPNRPPDYFFPYPPPYMNGLPHKMNEISVIQNLNGLPPMPPHLPPGHPSSLYAAHKDSLFGGHVKEDPYGQKDEQKENSKHPPGSEALPMTSMHHTPLPMYGLMKDSEQQRENGKLDRRDTPSNGPLPPPHSSPYSFKDPLYGGLKDSPFSSRDNYYGHKDERYARDERKAGTPHEGSADNPLPPVLRNGSSPPSQGKGDQNSSYNHNPTPGGELDLSIRSSSASSVGTHPSMDSPHTRAATPSTDTTSTHNSATLLWRSGYCQFCSRTFPSPSELEQHIQTEHLGGKDPGAKRPQPEPERNDDSDA